MNFDVYFATWAQQKKYSIARLYLVDTRAAMPTAWNRTAENVESERSCMVKVKVWICWPKLDNKSNLARLHIVTIIARSDVYLQNASQRGLA